MELVFKELIALTKQLMGSEVALDYDNSTDYLKGCYDSGWDLREILREHGVYSEDEDN